MSSDHIERTPPHNKEAEIAVLGGMLLDSEAMSKVIDMLKASYFYFPAHAALYEGIRHLYEKSQPADIVTLANYLKSKDLLENIGGLPYILDIHNSVPTTANIEYYARIVERNAILRRLIKAGTDIVQLGYQTEGEDISNILNMAEQKIFEIGEKRMKSDLEHVRPLLWGLFEKLEDTYNNDVVTKEHQTSGLKDLDMWLGGGLHPSDLIILAARPAMGKTSLALSIGTSVALRDKKPVAIFSLEMSKEQLITRMLCAEAKMNAHALKAGTALHPDDWGTISEAISYLSEAPVYLDDSPVVTPNEIRSKVRRLKTEHKELGLVIIDYLQLMETGTSENRVQEISKISRGLKQLARELEVPVLALSQLSRAVEQRQSKKPMLSDLRECVVGETPVLLADGRRIPIKQLEGSVPEVLAVNQDGKVVSAISDKVWKVGKKTVYQMTLASGRTITASEKHKVFTGDGWKELQDIQVAERIALSRKIPEPQKTIEIPDSQIALLGQMIGDGSYIKGSPMRYTSASEDNLRVIEEGAKSLGSKTKRYAGKGNWQQICISGNGNRWHPEGVNRWFKELGIFGQRSKDKRIPEKAFQLSNRQTALLLRHLWATDGSIFVNSKSKGAHRIYFSSNSLQLVNDIGILLMRFGIVSRIKKVEDSNTKGVWYTLDVSGSENQLLFLKEIGAFGSRQSKAKELLKRLEKIESNTNVDTLPISIFKEVKKEMSLQGISQRKMAKMRGTSYGGSSHFSFSPSRQLIMNYATELNCESLKRQASNDLFWDSVIDISKVGVEDVYDLTVPGPSSWLSDGIVNHNSGSIEQDADIVMFLYRDEYYNPDSPHKNISEIIVAKHRHGPTGTVKVFFDPHYTKFADLNLDMV